MAYHQVTDQVTEDLKIAEAVAVPLTVLVLIWVFGSLVAALLPLAVGIFSIVGTLQPGDFGSWLAKVKRSR